MQGPRSTSLIVVNGSARFPHILSDHRFSMREVLAITNAMADASRVRAVPALTHGPLCVSQIVELLQLAPSTLSKHLFILLQAGLVESRKTGRWVYYSIP